MPSGCNILRQPSAWRACCLGTVRGRAICDNCGHGERSAWTRAVKLKPIRICMMRADIYYKQNKYEQTCLIDVSSKSKRFAHAPNCIRVAYEKKHIISKYTFIELILVYVATSSIPSKDSCLVSTTLCHILEDTDSMTITIIRNLYEDHPLNVAPQSPILA